MRFYSFRNMGGIQGADYNLNKQIRIFKGNKSIMNDYRLLLHDIINKGDEYILVSEAYYPEYHIEYFWSTDAYGRSYRESREVFDGYRYTNAIITAFDSKGLLLWNNSFEIWNILTFNLKERVKVHFDGEDIVLAYSNAGKINSKIIRKNEVIQPKTESQVESISVADLKKPGITSDMDFWYKNYFITFGYEKLSRQPNISNAKTIFYFSKIAFQ
jgi:hypothetical protein